MWAPSFVLMPTEIHMNKWRGRVVGPLVLGSEGGDFMLFTRGAPRGPPLEFSKQLDVVQGWDRCQSAQGPVASRFMLSIMDDLDATQHNAHANKGWHGQRPQYMINVGLRTAALML